MFRPITAIVLWLLPLFSALLIIPQKRTSEKLIETGGIYFALVIIVEYCLGMLGLLSLRIVLIAQIIIFVLSVFYFRRRNKRYPKASDFVINIKNGIPPNLRLLLLGLSLIIVSIGFLNILKPPTHIDFLWGNLNDVVAWLQDKTLITSYNSPISFYYNNSFLYTVWIILPFNSDLLINLQNLPVIFLIVITIYAILQNFKIDIHLSIISSISVLSFPVFYNMLWKQRQEFMLAFFFLLSLYYFLKHLNNCSFFNILMSFIYLGLCVGTKSTMLLLGAIIFIIFSAISILKHNGKNIKFLLISAVSCLIISFMWPFRNWIIWDNPFYPMNVTFLSSFIPVTNDIHSLEIPSIHETSLFFNFSFQAFKFLLQGIYLTSYGLIGIAGFLLSPFLILKGFIRKYNLEKWTIIILFVSTFIAYMFLPVTAQDANGHLNIISKGGNIYYSVLSFVLSPILILLMFDRKNMNNLLKYIFISSVFLLIFFYFDQELYNYTFVLLITLPLLTYAYLIYISHWHFKLALFIILLISIVIIFPRFQEYAVQKRYDNELFSFTNGVSKETIKWVNSNTRENNISIYKADSSDVLRYPFYGYFLDNKIRVVDNFCDTMQYPQNTDYLIICAGKKEKPVSEWGKIGDKIFNWTKREGCITVLQTPTEIILKKNTRQ